ncbi:MAG: hypothetical protein AAF628_26220 [Planctomycetota bacterium]
MARARLSVWSTTMRLLAPLALAACAAAPGDGTSDSPLQGVEDRLQRLRGAASPRTLEREVQRLSRATERLHTWLLPDGPDLGAAPSAARDAAATLRDSAERFPRVLEPWLTPDPALDGLRRVAERGRGAVDPQGAAQRLKAAAQTMPAMLGFGRPTLSRNGNRAPAEAQSTWRDWLRRALSQL